MKSWAPFKERPDFERFRRMVTAGLITALLAAAAPAADTWVIFRGQNNGPAQDLKGIDLSTFRHQKFPGIYWSEVYYHHLSFADGSMITVQAGFNAANASIVFLHGKPGLKPVTEFYVTDIGDLKFDGQGFGMTIGPNRIWLNGGKYHLHLDMERIKADIVCDILSPSYSYGDGMVRYPDGKSFESYTLPISWAKVSAHAVIEGKKYDLEGYGNMNHDAGVLSPFHTPANWQVFWFFGPDHAVAVTDYNARPGFGSAPVQRLVFVDQDRGLFTSTSFDMKWDDWTEVPDISFRYPRHYTLSAEGGGGQLTVEVRIHEVLMVESLFANLPPVFRAIAEKVTANIWAADCWADYTAAYSRDGVTKTYQGRGIVRWTDLEKE